MSEKTSQSLDQHFPCGLCGMICHSSLLAMRGKLNFCQSCSSERAAECLKRLKNYGKSPRIPMAVSIFVGLGIVAASVWGVRTVSKSISLFIAQLGSDAQESASPPRVPASTPIPIAADASGAKALVSSWTERLFNDKSLRQVTDVGNIHLLFVTAPGTDACMGLSSRLYATREAPDKVTAKLMTAVGPDMETSFQEGLRYVRKLPRDWEKDFSIRLSFEDKFTSKDGGSAGTAFTLAMLAAIEGIRLDPDVAVTGDLTIDGGVQKVGAVVEKLRGAIAGKCKIILIPAGNARDPVDMAVLDGTSPLWEAQIFSVDTVGEAMGIARQNRDEKVQAAISKFDLLRTRLPAVVTPNYLLSPIVQSELKEVLKLAPNHLSASILLRAAENQFPKELSLNRSVEEILAASYLFVQGVIAPSEKTHAQSDRPGITLFPEREYGECLKKLTKITPILDTRSLELKTACIAYAAALRGVSTYKAATMEGIRNYQRAAEIMNRERDYQQTIKDNYNATQSRLLLTLRKLSTDGSLATDSKK